MAEKILQAESAFGYPQPTWLDEAYYQREIVLFCFLYFILAVSPQTKMPSLYNHASFIPPHHHHVGTHSTIPGITKTYILLVQGHCDIVTGTHIR
jgi:hypothetical protein